MQGRERRCQSRPARSLPCSDDGQLLGVSRASGDNGAARLRLVRLFAVEPPGVDLLAHALD
eukprot:13351821-Alexandrium_andersonii.AAC.1